MADEGPVNNETLLASLMGAGFLYLKLSPNRAELAALMADRWATIARLEKHEADRKRLDWRPPEAKRTPSGTFSAVIEALKHPKDET